MAEEWKIPTIAKDPSAVLDYGFNWDANNWLANISDTIATSVWAVPDGITQDSETETATTTTIWLSGGTLGQQYTIVNTITTTGGRTNQRSFVVDIVDK